MSKETALPPVFSVKQPWAGLLLAGVKRFEVRTWYPTMTGPLLLHASSGRAVGLPALRRDKHYAEALRRADMIPEDQWLQSAILGIVEVVRVWFPDSRAPKLSALDRFLCGGDEDGDLDGLCLWEVGGRWPFKLPVPAAGKLNLWDVRGPLRERVRREVARHRLPDFDQQPVEEPDV